MKIGLIGLGKMGLNLAENMLDNNIEVLAFDVFDKARENAEKHNINTVDSIEQLVKQLDQPRIIWIMVPAGAPTNDTIGQLSNLLSKNDVVIDGGNTYYQDSLHHNQVLSKAGIYFFDVGTSGGMSGARHGGNFMIGGDKDKFGEIEPLFKAIAEKDGYLYTGQAGSGHYLKMVHNGIEYGMMQAIGEGFEVLSKSEFDYDNEAVAKVWNHGSVVRSWLMELAQSAFSNDPNLDEIKGVMHSSGEGAWRSKRR